MNAVQRPRVLAALCLLALGTALLVACSRQTVDARLAAFAQLPDWTGIWRPDAPPVGVDGFPFINTQVGPPINPMAPLTVFNREAPLNEAGRARVQAVLQKGDPARNPEGAAGWGYPLMMYAPPPLQFLITPEETLIFNGYRDVRRIYTDGRERPPEEDRWPATTWGDSIGRWEGDTLVIDTVDVRDPAGYFGVSMPFSSRAHYTERLRKVGPDRIEGEMIIEDPELLTAPMTVKLVYVRETMMDRLVLDSFGEDRTGFDGEFNTIED